MVLEQQKQGFKGKPSRIAKVFSISDLLPNDEKALAPRVERLKKILLDPKLDRAEEKEGKRAEQLALARKMARATPWGIADLPESFRRRATTKDGKGYLVFIWPVERNDADYQALAWEEELEHISEKIEKAGIPHLKADETLMMAWIYRTIQADIAPLVLLAALVVIVCLLLDFRRVGKTLLVVFPLVVGMLSLVALIRILRMELNMFNMVVIPSIIGIGIDNAVHIYHRYTSEGPGSTRLVIRTTGMAALLASATTGIGFGATLISHHVGLQTLGSLAVTGIAVTFVASTLFFPCFLILIEKLGRKAPQKDTSDS
jgi:predicted RND superfamily exporter protein